MSEKSSTALYLRLCAGSVEMMRTLSRALAICRYRVRGRKIRPRLDNNNAVKMWVRGIRVRCIGKGETEGGGETGCCSHAGEQLQPPACPLLEARQRVAGCTDVHNVLCRKDEKHAARAMPRVLILGQTHQEQPGPQ